ncbi:hypothetical protein N0V87_008256 [Didymella glomerata]|jgi:hypothetical protein|uniref:RING-type domain-containing protein n=1 Tax=Didymella glomerata TaxID=749621 RepID=A0A9W9BWB3_9PLEO|nr:hypothetical protein N0V87_008256 [Didymella glomerata]
MSQATGVSLAYPTKEAFQSQGLSNVLLHAALDCSICREPLAITLEHESCSVLPAAVLSIGHTTVNAQEIEGLTMSGQDSTTAASPDNSLVPEEAVRISPCSHIFGRACLEAWLTTSESNRCPECNQELFPHRHMMLFLRQPIRSVRLEFADCIEHVCGDSETAGEIRENLMGDWTRTLIREFAMELWRQQGYEVDYQYINGADADDEQEETEIGDTSEDDDDADDADETDAMDTDRREVGSCVKPEYGLVKRA